MGILALTSSSNCAVHDPTSEDPQVDLQALESLQELSNVSSDQAFSPSSPTAGRGPISIKIQKDVLLSSASQTLSPRTPTQSHSSDSKQCVNCHCTSTPLWRKDKSSGLNYCNACGIYFKNHGKHRPMELIEGPTQIKVQQPLSGLPNEAVSTQPFMTQNTGFMQAAAECQDSLDWEEQRSELIDGLLSASSPSQLAMQEAVNVLLYMAQDDSSASGSGADSPQACDADDAEGLPASGRKLRRRARKAVTSVRSKYMKRPAAANKQGTACNNCHTTYTPLWRKDCNTGEILCNACGIYLKTHGKPRALEGMMANAVRAGQEETQARASQASSRASSDTDAPQHGSPPPYRHQSAQTQTYTHSEMPDGAVHRVHISARASHGHAVPHVMKSQRRSNIKTSSDHAQHSTATPHMHFSRHQQQSASPRLFKEPSEATRGRRGGPTWGPPVHAYCSMSQADSRCQERSALSHGNGDHMAAEQSTGGFMQQPGVVPAGLGPCAGAPLPAGLSPHAAAALQFWLSQGALNPHVHASYLYSLQGPCGEPLGHHFSGLAAAFAAQPMTPQ